METNAFLENGITVGIEFETDYLDSGSIQEGLYHYWRDTHDASIQTDVKVVNTGGKNIVFLSVLNGIVPTFNTTIGTELISKIINPDNEKIFNIINNLTTFLLEYGEPEVSERCGIHFHITLSNPSLNTLKSIIRMGRYFEALFFRLGCMGYKYRGEKNDSIYSRPLTKWGPPCVKLNHGYGQCLNIHKLLSSADYQDFWGNYSDTLSTGNERYRPQRYFWLNVFPLYQGHEYRGTLEFRVFNKTLNPEFIVASLELCRGFTQLATELSPKKLSIYNINNENSVFDTRDTASLLKDLEFFYDFMKISDNTFKTLNNIIKISPPVELKHGYIYSHVAKEVTFWRAGSGDILLINDEDIREPNYIDIHRIRGER